MATIQFKDGAVLFVDGAIAMDPACCCGCSCCEKEPQFVTIGGVGEQDPDPCYWLSPTAWNKQFALLAIPPGPESCSWDAVGTPSGGGVRVTVACDGTDTVVEVGIIDNNWTVATFRKTVVGVRRIDCSNVGALELVWYDNTWACMDWSGATCSIP